MAQGQPKLAWAALLVVLGILLLAWCDGGREEERVIMEPLPWPQTAAGPGVVQ